MLPVGGRPVLEHLLHVFARQGATRFVLAAGYLADVIVGWARTLPDDWQVDVVDTGDETATGERIRRCADRLGDRFFATYGDGLADVDLTGLLADHGAGVAKGGLGTVTTVPLPCPYGITDADESGAVTRFVEKPLLADHRINGGFLVFEASVFDVWSGIDLEREVLPALADRRSLYTHRHDGFWRSLDTYKDQSELEALAVPGSEPWFSASASEVRR
jgi:glucose-1-phosphate cytidylyltransferase